MPKTCRHAGCRSASVPDWRYCAPHLALALDRMEADGYLTPPVATAWATDGDRLPIDDGPAPSLSDRRRRGPEGRPCDSAA